MSTQSIKELKKYENKWVALKLSSNKVVGSGNDAVEALHNAEKNGHKDAVLFKVFPLDKSYIG